MEIEGRGFDSHRLRDTHLSRDNENTTSNVVRYEINLHPPQSSKSVRIFSIFQTPSVNIISSLL